MHITLCQQGEACMALVSFPHFSEVFLHVIIQSSAYFYFLYFVVDSHKFAYVVWVIFLFKVNFNAGWNERMSDCIV